MKRLFRLFPVFALLTGVWACSDDKTSEVRINDGTEFLSLDYLARSGKITVTGSLGDVMKESAQLAVTWVRVHAAEYGIDPEKLKKCDLHIHAPEGAVPKDGPSAGVTLTTALVSCLSGIPVRGDVAMTGEITLHGNVLPIGGLREKSMAAYREGMETVLSPKDNEPDLYEVDDEVKKNLTFLPMQSLTQVLNAALLKPQNAKKAKAPSRTHAKKKAADAAIVPPTAEKPQPGAQALGRDWSPGLFAEKAICRPAGIGTGYSGKMREAMSKVQAATKIDRKARREVRGLLTLVVWRAQAGRSER